MGRHKNPQYNRKRLVVAGIAAVTTLGVAVGIGVYGSAFADRGDQNPVANEQCLPTDGAPPPEETAPPEDNNGDQNGGDGQNGNGDQGNGGQDGGQGDNGGQNEDQNNEDQNGGQDDGQNGQDGQNGGEDNAPGTVITETEQPKSYGYSSGGVIALNGERPKGTQPDDQNGDGQNGGDQNGGQNGGDQNGGGQNGGGNGDDYSGPKPPTQAPEPPPDAPVDDIPDECEDQLGPVANDFIDINNVEPNNLADSPDVQQGGSNGTFVSDCGVNEEGHFNSANFIVAPGNENGAEHTHDYVGNEDTDGFSDNNSLAAAGTTCENQDDKSAYFWPVIRVRNEGSDAVDPLNAHNIGDIQRPVSAKLEFRGNAADQVEAMPQFLRVLTGNAKSFSQDGVNQNAKWTCTGFEDRITAKYPLCPEGSNTVRIADFPGCWDGQNTDSANHRTHVAFADENGECQDGFVAIPQLRITITYDLPQGEIFALDAFPTEFHSPVTDHNDFVNVFSEDLMDQVVDCINNGQQC
jgi:hypothetical protein